MVSGRKEEPSPRRAHVHGRGPRPPRAHLLRREALRRVGDEDVPDEVLHALGDTLPVLGLKRVPRVLDEAEELVLVVLLRDEGRVPAEQDVEDDPERPDVDLHTRQGRKHIALKSTRLLLSLAQLHSRPNGSVTDYALVLTLDEYACPERISGAT